MPYVNVQITREGDTSAERKAEIIQGITKVLEQVLGKDPKSTFVVIEEVDLDNWGIGGLPVEAYRERKSEQGRSCCNPS
jgi:4-oxalocrotonate tautomerase